jgi:uncharacterized protein YndB with AHSA1/START domain
MERLCTVVDIDQPPSVVYDFLKDDENKPLWMSNFVRHERIKGAEGEVGSVSRQIFKNNGRSIVLLEEITSARQAELLENRLENEQFKINFRNELRPKGSGKTELKVTFELWPKTFWAQLRYFLQKNPVFQWHQKDILKLKTAVETLGED